MKNEIQTVMNVRELVVKCVKENDVIPVLSEIHDAMRENVLREIQNVRYVNERVVRNVIASETRVILSRYVIL